MRVVIADDHPLFVRALVSVVEAAGIAVAGTASNGAELLELVERIDADAALIDIHMPVCDGLTCIAELRRSHPGIRAIAVSADDDPETVGKALDAGAVCLIGKTIEASDLVAVLRAVLSDIVHVSGRDYTAPPPAPQPRSQPREGVAAAAASELTPRELEILLLASSGMSNRAIAESVWVTEQTVKFHLSNIYRKIGVGNRTQASAWAREHGVFDAQPLRPLI